MEKTDQPESLNLTGIVLAGGLSKRLGKPKPLLRINGQTILERIAAALNNICTELVAVVRLNQEDEVTTAVKKLGIRIVHDASADTGPLGGIERGMSVTKTNLSFVIGADYPFLSSKLISTMGKYAEDYDAVVPLLNNRIQPLHSIYRPKAWLPVVKSALGSENLSPSTLLEQAISTGSPRVLTLGHSNFSKHHHGLLSFIDIDNQQDLAHARDLASKWPNLNQPPD